MPNPPPAATNPDRSDWIAVACAEHIRRGVAGRFAQVNHGKAAPLRRLRPGDRLVYYAPTEAMGGGPPLQQFTALGVIADAPVEQVDSGNGFMPFRRAVRWLAVKPAPIRPLLEQPGFALSGPGWGARLRFGLLRIDAASMDAIAAAMHAPAG